MNTHFTAKQKWYRTRLLARIHQAPLYKQMDEDTYRDMLEVNFGKRSAADLNLNQLNLLLDYLNNKRKDLVEHCSTAQQNYIKSIWKQKARNPSDTALREFIQKLFKKTIINLNALQKHEASGLINAINRM